MEAHWDGSKPGAIWCCSPSPMKRTEKNDYEISIPNGASLIITHQIDGLFPGLKDFKKEDRPPVLIPFFGFRLMVGIGLWFILMCAWGAFRWWKGVLYEKSVFLTLAWWSWPLGFVAILAGWFTTEVGRQPWIAAGILRTADAASPVSALQVAISLGLFVVVYGIVFTAGIYYINRLIHAGPTKLIVKLEEHGSANRPISGAESAGHEIFGSKGVTVMDQITFWLPVVWIGVLGVAIALYIILDGFDLGIGILFPFGNTEEERDQMMNSIAPFWDGNETWLILGGGGLWVAFPQAFAIIMPALYVPIILMLLALVFRGVAFEFRFVSKPFHNFWDGAFFGGSLLATVAQGFVLGGLDPGH